MSTLFPLMGAAGNVADAGADTDANFENTVLLINGDGAADGGQNNTFLDTSGNGHAITRNGNVTQGSFSPFAKADGKWGNSFDRNGDYVNVANSTDFAMGTGDFTIEGWVYFNSFQNAGLFHIDSSHQSTNIGGIAVGTNVSPYDWRVYYGTSGANSSTPIIPHQWQHFAYVRNSGTTKLYADGAEVFSVADTTNYTDQYLFFGGYYNTSYLLDGYLSNLRVVKGTAVYTADFTVPTEPLTAITGTSLLTCQSNRFVDNSTNNFALTVNGNPEVTTFSPFPETTAYTRSTINQGAMEFDGSSDYLDVDVGTSLQTGTNNFTIEFWFKNNASPNFAVIFDLYDSSDDRYLAVQFGSPTSNMLYLENGTTRITTSGISPNDGYWHHHAVVRNGSTVTYYIDGISRGTYTTTLNLSSGDTARIGEYSATSGYNIDGYLSNFRFVNGTAVYTSDFTVPTEPLTDITNTSLLTCQAAGAVDNSSNAHAITVNGDAKQSVFVPFGERSVEFDGNDYLSHTAVSLTGDFTLECWFNQTAKSSSYIPIISGSTGSYNFPIILDYNTSGTVGLYLPDATSSNNNGSFSLGTWNHIALTRSGTSIKLFLNGTQVASVTSSTTITVDNLGGWSGGTSNRLNGYVSNARIVNGTAVYTADFTPPTEPLTAITNTSLLTCQNAVFQDNSGNAHTITANGDPQASTNLPFGERSVAFDGSGDYLTTPADTSLSIGTSDFTLEAWVFWSNAGSNNRIFLETRSGSTTDGFNIGLSSTNYYLKMFYNSSDVIIDNVTFPEGEWVHVALSRSGSSTKLFKNGVQVGSTYSDSNNYSNNDMIIGNNSSLNRDWGGYLSNVRLVKGTALYTADFTPPTEPLTAVSGTSLLTCQDAVFQDNSGNAHAITVNGDAEASTNIPFAPVTTYGVQQYLDDAFTVSPQGGSGYFDGTENYIKVSGGTSLDFGTGDFAVECWVYPQSSSSQVVFGQIDDGNGRDGVALGIYSATNLWWLFGNGSAWVFQRTPSYSIELNAWTHLAVTRSGSTAYLFANGVQVDTVSDSTSLSQDALDLTYVGGVPQPGYDLNGYLSNVRAVKGTAVYTSAFTPPTVPLTPTSGTSLLLNFTNASIVDATGRNVIETVGNAQVDTTTVKYGTGAMEFDGTGDYLVAPASEQMAMGTGDFTAECWVYRTSTGSFFDTRVANDAAGFLVQADTNGKLALFTNAAFRITDSGTALPTSEWFHVALVRSSGTTTLYKNGTSVGTYSDSNNYNAGALTVGSNFGITTPITGFIDDLRITKGIARYTANFTPPTKALPVIGE